MALGINLVGKGGATGTIYGWTKEEIPTGYETIVFKNAENI